MSSITVQIAGPPVHATRPPAGRARIASRAMEQTTALVFLRFHRRLKRVLEQEAR